MGGCCSKEVKLTKDDIDKISKLSDLTNEEINEWHQEFLEDCPDGKLTLERLQEAIEATVPGGSGEFFAKILFASFDTKKAAFLTFVDYMQAIHITTSTPEDKLRWAFRLFEVDSDGCIDEKKILRAVKAVYFLLSGSPRCPFNTSEDRTSKIYETLEKNEEGKISEEAFIRSYLSSEEINQALLFPPRYSRKTISIVGNVGKNKSDKVVKAKHSVTK